MGTNASAVYSLFANITKIKFHLRSLGRAVPIFQTKCTATFEMEVDLYNFSKLVSLGNV